MTVREVIAQLEIFDENMEVVMECDHPADTFVEATLPYRMIVVKKANGRIVAEGIGRRDTVCVIQ